MGFTDLKASLAAQAGTFSVSIDFPKPLKWAPKSTHFSQENVFVLNFLP